MVGVSEEPAPLAETAGQISFCHPGVSSLIEHSTSVASEFASAFLCPEPMFEHPVTLTDWAVETNSNLAHKHREL